MSDIALKRIKSAADIDQAVIPAGQVAVWIELADGKPVWMAKLPDGTVVRMGGAAGGQPGGGGEPGGDVTPPADTRELDTFVMISEPRMSCDVSTPTMPFGRRDDTIEGMHRYSCGITDLKQRNMGGTWQLYVFYDDSDVAAYKTLPKQLTKLTTADMEGTWELSNGQTSQVTLSNQTYVASGGGEPGGGGEPDGGTEPDGEPACFDVTFTGEGSTFDGHYTLQDTKPGTSYNRYDCGTKHCERNQEGPEKWSITFAGEMAGYYRKMLTASPDVLSKAIIDGSYTGGGPAYNHMTTVATATFGGSGTEPGSGGTESVNCTEVKCSGAGPFGDEWNGTYVQTPRTTGQGYPIYETASGRTLEWEQVETSAMRLKFSKPGVTNYSNTVPLVSPDKCMTQAVFDGIANVDGDTDCSFKCSGGAVAPGGNLASFTASVAGPPGLSGTYTLSGTMPDGYPLYRNAEGGQLYVAEKGGQLYYYVRTESMGPYRADTSIGTPAAVSKDACVTLPLLQSHAAYNDRSFVFNFS